MESVEQFYPVLPGIALTVTMVAVWADVLRSTWRGYRAGHTREALHNIVIVAMAIIVSIASGVAQVAEYLTPPDADPLVISSLAVVRAVLLVVGVWAAWDRRVAHRALRFPRDRTPRDPVDGSAMVAHKEV